MANVAEAVEQILSAVKAAYPGWQNLDDPTFIKDELTYKRTAVEKARHLLGREEYSRLLQEGAYEEIRTRLKALANATNLLYRSQPSTSDISILTRPENEFPEIAREIHALLYGEGDSAQRLDRFVTFETARGYKATWPFPTYLLFLLNPGLNFFVKPTVVQWLLEATGASFQYVSKPSGEFYSSLLGLLQGLKETLKERGVSCSDMVDLQSLIWVAHQQSKTDAEHKEFLNLWGQFRKEYLETGKGERHLEQNRKAREEARAVYRKALEEEKAGTSITETVIRGFLPYRDSKNNLESGYWCPPTPVFNTDIRQFFAAKGWKWNWDDFAKNFLKFVRDTLEKPSSLEENCRWFLGKDYKGLQAASLSPILNALDPENFLLVNIKPLKTLERFGKKNHTPALEEYARTNEDLFSLYRDWADLGILEGLDTDLLPWSDYFDIFCHWLMAEKNYFDTKFWKIAPGQGARFWEEWKQRGIIAIGCKEMGDQTGVRKKADFDKEAEEYLRTHPDAGKKNFSKAWRGEMWQFINSISVGDRIVANQGKSKVLGLGTVTGKYRYEPEKEYQHVIPVVWDDLTPRDVSENGWQRTLLNLSREKFEEIEKLPPSGTGFESKSDVIEERFRFYYPDEKDLLLICSIFADAIEKAHEESPSSWCTTLLVDRLRLNAGKAATLDCLPGKLRVSVLVKDVPQEIREKWEAFENTFFSFKSIDEKTTGYDLPCQEVTENEQLVRKLLESFITKAVGKVKKTAYGGSHEPRIVAFLSEYLERGLPTPDYVDAADIDESGESISTESEQREITPSYTLEQVAEKTGYPLSLLERWKRSLLRKKQAVFYGPPGTGKTFIAKEMARHLVGGGKGSFEVVQFHPSYAYEDFIEGIRPAVRGETNLVYEEKSGTFLEFCDKAAKADGDPCVLIVDEINRAPLSRVFGELMYLLEYRGETVNLASGRKFSIPENVFLIGTMNTADRSIALVDHALRRRFAFISLFPRFEVLHRYHDRHATGFDCDGLVKVLEGLNKTIGDPNFSIGVSFFMRNNLAQEIEDIWRMEIEPYLEEYFYEKNGMVDDFRWEKVRSSILPESS